MPIGTVMSRISRGRRLLYERLAGSAGGGAVVGGAGRAVEGTRLADSAVRRGEAPRSGFG